MKTKLLLLVAFLLAITAFGNAQTYWTDDTNYDISWWGNASVAKMYNIGSSSQLAGVAYLVNNGYTTFKDTTINLTGEVDLAAHHWMPIGITETNSFQGSFNGKDKKITNLTIDFTTGTANAEVAGLFGYVSYMPYSFVKIENIIIESGSITGGSSTVHTGGVIGCVRGRSDLGTYAYVEEEYSKIEIYNCVNNATVTGGNGNDSYTGGIIGHALGYIDYRSTVNSKAGKTFAVQKTIILTGCINNGAVTGKGIVDSYTGGIIGYAREHINERISANGTGMASLFTISQIDIIECYNTNNITGGNASISYTGGIVGYGHAYCEGTKSTYTFNSYNSAATYIHNCGSTGGTITGSGTAESATGGIIGYGYARGIGEGKSRVAINKSYNSSLIKSGSVTNNTYTGGILGQSYHTNDKVLNEGLQVADCYSASNIIASKGYAGGLIGYISLNNDGGVALIWTSYAAGKLQGEGAEQAACAGGLVGAFASINNAPLPLIEHSLSVMDSIRGTTKHRIVGRLMNITNGVTTDITDPVKIQPCFGMFGNYAIARLHNDADWTVSLLDKDGENWSGSVTSKPFDTEWRNTVWDFSMGATYLPFLQGGPKVKIGGGITFTVIFDSRGGNQIPQADNLNSGDLVTKPADPLKAGYIFEGWYTDLTYSTAWTFDTDQVTDNITLYAKWTSTLHTVIFDYQYDAKRDTLDNIAYNSLLTEPTPIPVRDGYTFDGWYKEASCINAWVFSSATVSSSITLFARWTPVPVDPVIPPITPPVIPPITYIVEVTIPEATDYQLNDCLSLYPAAGEYDVEQGGVLTLRAFLSNECDESDLYIMVNGIAFYPEEKKDSLRAIVYTFMIPVTENMKIEIVGLKSNNPVGVSEATAHEAKIYTIPEYVMIENNRQGDMLRIYSMTGILMNQQKNLPLGTTSVRLPKGTYLVVVGDKVVKVVL